MLCREWWRYRIRRVFLYLPLIGRLLLWVSDTTTEEPRKPYKIQSVDLSSNDIVLILIFFRLNLSIPPWLFHQWLTPDVTYCLNPFFSMITVLKRNMIPFQCWTGWETIPLYPSLEWYFMAFWFAWVSISWKIKTRGNGEIPWQSGICFSLSSQPLVCYEQHLSYYTIWPLFPWGIIYVQTQESPMVVEARGCGCSSLFWANFREYKSALLWTGPQKMSFASICTFCFSHTILRHLEVSYSTLFSSWFTKNHSFSFTGIIT